MRFPFSLVLSTAFFILRNKIAGKKRFPLVLALEPTHRCNLFCQGCGRIREYRDSFGRLLTLEQALAAVEEVKAPVVAITGGEPLLYPEIDALVRAILKRRRHVFLATNGILLQGFLEKVPPHPRLTLVLHLDGLAETHDRLCGRPGTFEKVIEGIKKAKRKGFRVVTNTVLYQGTTTAELEALFTSLAALQIDGMLLTPAFSSPGMESDIFLLKDEVHQRLGSIHALANRFKL
ncbi:MAG: adenosyl-hopene transferase HpnH, partial [Candidatus Methylomirabilales bacterium]